MKRSISIYGCGWLFLVLAAASMDSASSFAVAQEPVVPASYQSERDFLLVRWERRPIKLTLQVGEERMIVFPSAIQPGVPPSLARKVRVQVNGDTVFFKAHEQFEETRFPVRDLATGRIFLLDLSASSTGSNEDVRILLSDDNTPTEQTSVSPSANESIDTSSTTYGYVDLARFAAKQFYAPERLAQGLPGVRSVSLPEEPTRRLVRGGDILATPRASWRAPDGLTVTAIEIRNLRTETVDWNPARVRGSWLAAATQHNELGPSGTPADTSVLYLISDMTFEEAAGPWLYK